MKSIIRKMAALFLIAIAITSCSKDEKPDKEVNGECWYKITIDGQTTLPNRFGQDNILLNSSSYPVEGDGGFLLSIIQMKANGSRDPIFDFSAEGAHFNRETLVGTTYTANFFHAFQLGSPELDGFEYDKGRHGNQGEITLSIEENSDQQIRFSITGTVMKWQGGVENPQEVELVPVEAEFTIGRSNYFETTSGGVFATGVSCECKD